MYIKKILTNMNDYNSFQIPFQMFTCNSFYFCFKSPLEFSKKYFESPSAPNYSDSSSFLKTMHEIEFLGKMY